jgi:hypothetical protein
VSETAFLTGGGALGERIAAFDWARTPIGPLAQWPSSLRHTVSLMLRSPVPLVLLWGEHGVMIYNEGYAAFAGDRDSDLLGSNVVEGWGEVADFNANVLKVGLAGGTLKYTDQEFTLHRHGHPERVWLNLDYSPVLDEAGNPAGIIAMVVETSEAVRTRATLEESETKLRFLDDLNRAVADMRRERDTRRHDGDDGQASGHHQLRLCRHGRRSGRFHDP